MSLFDHMNDGGGRDLTPLADRMRPETLDDFFGQEHIVGKGRLLRRAIEADRMTSCIFTGRRAAARPPWPPSSPIPLRRPLSG